jgi:hypothetical protein
MPSIGSISVRGKALGAAFTAVAAFLAMSGTASAAVRHTTLPAPGAALITNGNFHKPAAKSNEGATPTNWTVVNLGAETDPYAATFGVYNAKGEYPPPAGNPDKADVAAELFYESGTATGVEGIGGQQTVTKSVTQANDPQIAFSDVQTYAPEAKNADWAGNGLQINFIHAKQTYSLIYFNPGTAYGTTPFPDLPANSATTVYVLGSTLTDGTWNTWSTQDLNTSIDTAFGFKTYRVTSVTCANLEDTIDSGYPYANMTGYFADVSVTEGSGS